MKLMAKISAVKYHQVRALDDLCVPVGIGSVESAEELGKSLLLLRDKMKGLAHDSVIRLVVRFDEVDESDGEETEAENDGESPA